MQAGDASLWKQRFTGIFYCVLVSTTAKANIKFD